MSNDLSDGCIDGLEYIFSPEMSVNFTLAFDYCVSLEGILAIPATAEKFDRIDDLRRFGRVDREPFYGLLSINPTSDKQDFITERFLTFPAEEPNPYTSGEARIAPWDRSNPNDDFRRQDCISVARGLLSDNECRSERSVMCERFCGEAPRVTFSQCELGEVQYYINNDEANLDGAINGCRRIDSSGVLAIPLNNTSLEEMVSFLQANQVDSALIGLVDFFGEGGTNATRFQSVLADRDEFFEIGGEFPWAVGQPDDLTANENCVVINENGLLSDVNCSQQQLSLCQRPCVLENNELIISDEISYTVGIMALLGLALAYFVLSKLKRELTHIKAGIELHTSVELDDDF